jgi:FkbM family methyltransferase
MWLGRHEAAINTALLDLVQPGMVVYDVGAHIGYTALLMAHGMGRDGAVMAYEPDPENFALLRRNAEINGLAEVVRPRAVALGSAPGAGGLARGPSSVLTRVQPQVEGEVRITTLDDEVFRDGMPAPDLIVIDVEGMELQVLAGASRVLAEIGPSVVCEDQRCRDEVMAVMGAHGYRHQVLDAEHVLYWRDPAEARATGMALGAGGL